VLECRVFPTPNNLEFYVFISNAFAQAAPAASGGVESLLSFAPIYILMFAVLYFFMIRPQMKRQKEQRALIDAIGKGDEIVTIGGVLGTVTKVSDPYLTVTIAPNTEIVVQKSAVSALLPKGTIKTL
jgi:preprotein translocase subunit YajC